jgi:asparagine synthase (glutamine-hydrolysing)
MCGICGAIQIEGRPRQVVAPDVLDLMTDAMTHRGPNDRGTYMAEGVALGVRRLSIVDVESGHQPFLSEDGGVVAVQNGELYNHGEIRSELARDGHVLRTRCDTEILPHVYERDGRHLPERLRGKFALAVWDSRERTALLARDPLGVKPLYYAVAGDVLVFASELKALLASGLVVPEIDYEAIDAYLALGYVPAPRSPLVGVSKLLPGHRLIVGNGRITVEPYWRYPAPVPDRERLTEREWADELLDQLDEAVRLRLMSDVPLGAMLSGGLDSSLVVALMSRHMTEPVKTFSVGFADAGAESELADARLVAAAFGTEHHELELRLSDADVDLADLSWWLDEPLADLSALGFFHISRLASEHVTVALSGQGADELYGGYRKHVAASLCNSVPRPIAGLAGSIAARGPARVRRTGNTLRAASPSERVLAMSGKLAPSLRRRLVRGPLAQLDGDAALRAIEARAAGLSADPLAETLFLDAQLALPDDMLHYFDRTSMAHSLEVRVPFLDHHVVEFSARIPSRYKVRRLVGKRVLRTMAEGRVPDRVLEKRKAGFFRGSVDSWLRHQARGALSDWLLAPEPAVAEFIDPAMLRSLCSRFLEGDRDVDPHLVFSILMLEVWLSSYVPRATAQRPRSLDAVRLAG